MEKLADSLENIFRPEFQALLDPETGRLLHSAVASSMLTVYAIVIVASICCLWATLLLRKGR